MAKKKTAAIIAQPGTPADGYTLDVKYDPENNDDFEAKAIFNDGTVRSLGSGGSGGSDDFFRITISMPEDSYVIDKSAQEIRDAVNNGLILTSVLDISGETKKVFPLTYVEGNYFFEFCIVNGTDPGTGGTDIYVSFDYFNISISGNDVTVLRTYKAKTL